MERKLGVEFGIMMLRIGRQVLTLYSVTSHDGPGPERNRCPRCRGGSLAMTARIRLQAAVRMVPVQLRTCYCQHPARPSAAPARRHATPGPDPAAASVTVKDSGHHASESRGRKGHIRPDESGRFRIRRGSFRGIDWGLHRASKEAARGRAHSAPVEAPTTGPPWPWPKVTSWVCCQVAS